MAGGRIKSDALYLGLTRPAMMIGVTYSFFTLNLVLSASIYIWEGGFITSMMWAVGLHIVGRYMCMKDPRMFDIFFLRMSKGFKCLNRNARHFGNNSYDLC